MTTVRRRVQQPATLVLAAVALVAAAVDLTGGTIPIAVQVVPFLASIVVLGLPHGALDHLVPARLGLASTGRSVAVVIGLYLVLGAADLALWALAPAAGFVGFVLLTWFHWGQGDLFTAEAFDGVRGGRAGRAALLVLRGGIPMLMPLIVQPSAYAQVLSSTTVLFAPGAAARLAPLLGPGPRVVAGAVLVAALVAERIAARRLPAAVRRRTAAETALLIGYFAVVPPVLAVGLYFCLWHALQHVVRLQLLDPASARAFAIGRLRVVAGRFALAAAPMTAGALVLLAVLALVVPPAAGPAGLLGLYLVLISALTVPHAVVVGLMDRRQGVWSPSRPAVPG